MKPSFASGIRLLLASAVLSMGSLAVQAQNAAPKAADNTAMNKGDTSKNAMTADSAKNNKSDIKIMQEIRKAVIADKSLSTNAHNVKIISKHGMVTLKGPVRSDEEKSNIEAKAKEVAGADKVTNQISIAPGKSKS